MKKVLNKRVDIVDKEENKDDKDRLFMLQDIQKLIQKEMNVPSQDKDYMGYLK